MRLYKYIFGNRWSYRFYRHAAFWVAVFIFNGINNLLLINNAGLPLTFYLQILPLKLFLLTLDMIYSYTLVYFIFPKSSNRIVSFFILASVLGIFILFVNTLGVFWYRDIFKLGKEDIILELLNQVRNFFRSGPVIICCLFASCKAAKFLYLKVEDNKALLNANMFAELQLLKAQVHPHFLFNTLNNIYSLILKKASNAGILIDKLSGVLKYMIFDCQQELVPLEKELQMVANYSGLEKIRYGERLKMDIEITGDTRDRMIAPLLLIPFLENSFKHGASQMLEYPWIKLEINISESELLFSLSNSKPYVESIGNEKRGIGLRNVKKRLQILYPGQHQLTTVMNESTFSVILKFPIHGVSSHPVAFRTGEPSDLFAIKAATYA